VLRNSQTAATALFVVHGPPAEPTNLHAHVVAYSGSASADAIRRDILTALNTENLLAPSPFAGPPRNRKTERDDGYGFAEWLDRCGFYDSILEAATPRDVADTLAAFSVAREPFGRGYVLRDRSAASGVAVKASSFDLSDDTLIARFGSPTLPPARDTTPRRGYAEERSTKYPEELYEAHADAATAWDRDIAHRLAADRRAVFAESLSRRNRRDSLARGVLAYADLPADHANLDAARRLVYRDTDRYVERELRGIEERYPAKPARRIGDWLRQLHDYQPAPVASAPGAALAPKPGQRIDDDVDRNLYDEDGIIIAHEDANGVELRTLEADVTLRNAREIVLNYRLESADIPARYDTLEQRFADAPAGPPPDVEAILDAAPAHQLDRAFAAVPDRETDRGTWTDDDRAYEGLSRARTGRRVARRWRGR
jgi:hypothetical protein